MLHELLELDLGHSHQSLDLVFGPVEVLDAEGVDRDDLDSGLVADFEDLFVCNVCVSLGVSLKN